MQGSHSADLFVSTTDGTCSLDAAENAGYIKAGEYYKLHISAMVTGICQNKAFVYPPGECQNTTQTVRTIGTSTLNVDSTLQGYVVVDPPNTATLQSYDTRTSTNTNSSGISYMTMFMGEHVLTSSTNTISTNCNFSPTTFPQNQSITFNALACKPNFLDDSGNPEGHVAPPSAPDKVQVFLDPATMSGAATALDNAIKDWNSRIGPTGVQYEGVSTSCGSGPSCIKVVQTTISGCGFSRYDPPDANGVIPGGMELRLHQDWKNFSPAGLHRTFVHELGHFIGVGNYQAPCGADDAMMSPAFDCGPGTSPSTTLTLNDYLPVLNSVYGGKSKLSCGF